jgi:hypothetical protein
VGNVPLFDEGSRIFNLNSTCSRIGKPEAEVHVHQRWDPLINAYYDSEKPHLRIPCVFGQ